MHGNEQTKQCNLKLEIVEVVIMLLNLSFRTFPLALDVGSGRGYIAQHLNKVLALQASKCLK